MGTQSHSPKHSPVSLPSFAEPLLSTGSPSIRPLCSPSVSSSGTTSHIDEIAQKDTYRPATTIDVLPNNVLLEIFDFYRSIPHFTNYRPVWNWHLLVHICRSWRQIIFDSPRRLNLQIYCTYAPVRKNLGIWPPFPIMISYTYDTGDITPHDEGNLIAALEHPDRVCLVRLYVPGSQLGKIPTVMQKPFPLLTCLDINSHDNHAPVLPAKFLGGSAPCLQEITLRGISFPLLPTLLLSTSDLVTLNLGRIAPTGYISPEAMVVGLAALPRLKLFILEFQSATSRPDQMYPPPVTRTALPALTRFEFKGASEYLEDFVSRIDSPQLDQISIGYLNQLVDFQVVQLSQFINRSVGPKLALSRHAHVIFLSDQVAFRMCPHANHPRWTSPRCYSRITITIRCKGIDWQVSHMAQVFSQFSATHSNLVHLNLKARRKFKGTDGADWQHLLRQPSTVRALHVSWELAGHFALELEGIAGEMITEVLPSLDLICLVGHSASSIEKFVAARQLSGRPVTVVDTTQEFDKRVLKSYISK